VVVVERIQKEVKEYHFKHAVGDGPADAFAAWWLTRRFDVAPIDAVKRAPGGAYDFGIDGFHLEEGEKPILHLFQAKFTSSRAEIKKGFDGFCKAMELLPELLDRHACSAPQQNTLLPRLALLLDQHADLIPKLVLNFRVLHLSDEDSTSLEQYLRPTLERFDDNASNHVPDHICRAVFASPATELSDGDSSRIPPEAQSIRFKGQDLNAGLGTAYFAGIGYLADLVRLYTLSGESLFAKNVRFYLRRQEQSGPAKYMRQTLRGICIDKKLPPEQFAILHNGVTLHAVSAKVTPDTLELRGPSVLNGCQTIVNATRFFEDRQHHAKIDTERWGLVPVPLRVITTTNEELVRQVAVSNNRQVAVRSSAFRAHDQQQLRLADRFAEMGIYYERQEGAFENLRAARPSKFIDTYQNSYDRPLRMEDLAQVIAIVCDQWALSTAAKSDLFEDKIYNEIFSDVHTSDLRLLVFLVNLHIVMPLVLKDLRKKSAVLSGLPIGRFRFPATKIFAKYVCRHQPKLVTEFGDATIGRVGAEHPLRVRLGRLTAAQNSGLQQLLPKHWMESDQWKSATDQALVVKALRELRLDNFDVFQEYMPATV